MSDALARKSDRIGAVLEACVSLNTRNAYRSDLESLRAWYVSTGRTPRIPPTDAPTVEDTILFLDYLVHDLGFKVATAERKLYAISTACRVAGLESPNEADIVARFVDGLGKIHGRRVESARPLLLDELFAVLASMRGDSSLAATRDRALLLLGFHAALRRSELAALRCSDIERTSKGLILTVRASKGDQSGQGQSVPIYARSLWCPVAHLDCWLDASKRADEQTVFVGFLRGSKMRADSLTARSVDLVIRRRCEEAGIDGCSGHSLRAGFCVSARQAGASEFGVMRITRHVSSATLHKYFARADLFDEDCLKGLA